LLRRKETARKRVLSLEMEMQEREHLLPRRIDIDMAEDRVPIPDSESVLSKLEACDFVRCVPGKLREELEMVFRTASMQHGSWGKLNALDNLSEMVILGLLPGLSGRREGRRVVWKCRDEKSMGRHPEHVVFGYEYINIYANSLSS
jgi:hypothetical protein